MKISLDRLRQIERGEISARLRKKLWEFRTKKVYSNSKSLENYPPLHQVIKISKPPSVIKNPVNTGEFYFPDQSVPEIADIYEKDFSREKKNIINEADKYCLREIEIFGISQRYDNYINWHLDALTGREWPMKLFSDIPYTGSDKIGDIKYAWELNRSHHLVKLGQAYLLTRDEKYAEEIVSQLNSWIESNPPFTGINWISPLEVGIRLINWVWAVHLIETSSFSANIFSDSFIRAVHVQAEHIYNRLSIGYYANNHLIGEAASLVIAGIYFKDFRYASKWRKKGLKILEREISKQIYPDGGGVEQAMSYLRFIVDFCLLATLLSIRNNIHVSPNVLERVEKALEFIMHSTTPNDSAPNFGDSDGARVLFLARNDYWDFRGTLALGAVLFSRPDFKMISGWQSEELLWLLGPDGFHEYNNMASEYPKTKSVMLMDSGYAIMRDSWDSEGSYMLFDCGPLGYRTGAHGHADALSIQVFTSGQRALIDPGTYAYNLETRFRNYFRGTKAHNTISIEDQNQAGISDRMSWLDIPTTEIKNYFFSDQIDLVCAENYGYSMLNPAVSHQRIVIFCKAPVYFLLIDKLNATDRHRYDLYFHLPAGSSVDSDEYLNCTVSNSQMMSISVRSTELITCEIKEGSDEPMGWYSQYYGHKTASPSLKYSCEANETAFIYSLIMPLPYQKTDGFSFEASRETDSSCLILNNQDEQDVWIINDCNMEKDRGDVCFSGESIMVRSDKYSKLIDAYGLDCNRFSYKGKPITFSNKPISGNLMRSKERN